MKQIIKKIIPLKFRVKLRKLMKAAIKKYPNSNKLKQLFYIIVNFFKTKIIIGKDAEAKILKVCKIKLENNESFVLAIDDKIFNGNLNIIDNITIDYYKVLSLSLEKLLNLYKDDTSDFGKSEYNFLLVIDNYLDRLINQVQKSNIENKTLILENLRSIKDSDNPNFHQSLQRILFYNSIAYQVGMSLNGLGRLDFILDSKYKNCKNVDNLIYDFLEIIHHKYEFKSGELLGDTGQIIVLGGLNQDGTYFSNDLTYKFIEQLKKLGTPDPKILLRVSEKMDKKLMETAVDCIKTGIGSPLLSNDDVVINKLIEFGYLKEDAYKYVVSACWEPLICGKSLGQNNIRSLNFAIPFVEMLEKENLDSLKTKDVTYRYFKYLKAYIKTEIDEINEITFAPNSLLSLFTDDCLKKHEDISLGGAFYNNYGVTTVGISTVVNSLLNIERLCDDLKLYSLKQLNDLRKDNFSDEKILKLLKNNNKKFGLVDEEVINLTNKIIEFISKEFSKYETKLKGKFTFGLSSPSYITAAYDFKATLDGRKNNEPFNTHISSNFSFDETISFASRLDYSGHAFNGNVIDFMITPDYIENNFEKFVEYLMLTIKQGFFQMQMNVTSSKILIEAKNNPKLYPNLIVRVWGFSAYFNDLPKEYKELLIERALENEGK